jgi:hypothetical protein
MTTAVAWQHGGNIFVTRVKKRYISQEVEAIREGESRVIEMKIFEQCWRKLALMNPSQQGRIVRNSMKALPAEFAGDICGMGKVCGPGIFPQTARKTATALPILTRSVQAICCGGVKFSRGK